MRDKTNLELVTQPENYFKELVTRALSQKQVNTIPETEVYLVNLLSQFITVDNLYSRDGQGNHIDEPLALMMKDALEEPARESQRMMFRNVGDTSLYIAGFFQESLERKLVDVSYYIEMGGTAYLQVAERAEQDSLQQMFSELGIKFSDFVGVFAEISGETLLPQNETDLLKVYDRWIKTKSDQAEKTLRRAGIPTDKAREKKKA